MNDIVERIRSLRYVHVPVASQLFEEACAEIQRLRLTDEERQAVEWAAAAASNCEHPAEDTLRSLLDRLRP